MFNTKRIQKIEDNYNSLVSKLEDSFARVKNDYDFLRDLIDTITEEVVFMQQPVPKKKKTNKIKVGIKSTKNIKKSNKK